MKPHKEEEKHKKEPFKLSFTERNLLGRSNIQIGKPICLPHVIAPKFYTKYWTENEHHEDIVQKYMEKLKVRGPREKFPVPVTENQKYGWYEIRLTDADWKDKRLNFHKRTDIIIKEHLMNYVKIRE